MNAFLIQQNRAFLRIEAYLDFAAFLPPIVTRKQNIGFSRIPKNVESTPHSQRTLYLVPPPENFQLLQLDTPA